MLDFTPVWRREQKLSGLAEPFGRDDLRDLTNEMVDSMLHLIAECNDDDSTFAALDPQATDQDELPPDQRVGWTLGHAIVHATASAEENAFLAAELARGIEFHGRSRYELPWETMTTIERCRQRLEESRRMRLASLDLWPDQPHFATKRLLEFLDDAVDARAQFLLGLAHDTIHLGQIAEIVRQIHEKGRKSGSGV